MALAKFLFAAFVCIVQLSQSEAASAVKEFHDWEGLKQDLVSTEYSIVDFFASWCPHCVTLAPKYEQAAKIISEGQYKDKVKLIKVQCDDNKEGGNKPICRANNIQGFPTINVYKKGIKLDQYRGQRTPEAIVEYAEQLVKTGKPKVFGKQVYEQHMCMASDFNKYVQHN